MDIKENIRSVEYPIEKSRGANRTNTMQICAERKKLFEDANKLDSNVFFLKYAPYSIEVKLKQIGRYAIWRLHLHNLVRHIKHMLIHR